MVNSKEAGEVHQLKVFTSYMKYKAGVERVQVTCGWETNHDFMMHRFTTTITP